ncbi:hypothetical protein HG531_011015 [Fusarium graminearum]|nr:hypothetical protein HG531_011015 [Fusarium graminearum]
MSLDIHGSPFRNTLKSTASSAHALADFLPVDEVHVGPVITGVDMGYRLHDMLGQIAFFLFVPCILSLHFSADNVVAPAISDIFRVTVDDTGNFRPLLIMHFHEITKLHVLLGGPGTTSNKVVEFLSGDVDDLLSVTVRTSFEDLCPKIRVFITGGCASGGVNHLVQFILFHIVGGTICLDCSCDTAKLLIAEPTLGMAVHSALALGALLIVRIL